MISEPSVSGFCYLAEDRIEFDAVTGSLRDFLCTPIRSACSRVTGWRSALQHISFTVCLLLHPSIWSSGCSLSKQYTIYSTSSFVASHEKLDITLIVNYSVTTGFTVTVCEQFPTVMLQTALTENGKNEKSPLDVWSTTESNVNKSVVICSNCRGEFSASSQFKAYVSSRLMPG